MTGSEHNYIIPCKHLRAVLSCCIFFIRRYCLEIRERCKSPDGILAYLEYVIYVQGRWLGDLDIHGLADFPQKMNFSPSASAYVERSQIG